MWKSIEKQLSEVLVFDYKICEKTRISGGDISESYMISDGEQRYFVKVNERSFLSRFTLEAEGIAALKQSDVLFLPEVVHVGYSKDHSFLILNYIPCKPIESSKASYRFGLQLAKHHNWGDQREFGFDSDNFIGATLQPNSWHKNWARFFSEQRIGWQLQLLREKGIEFGDSDMIVDVIYNRLASHHPTPSLLHGDLWGGNVSNTPVGPMLYDSAPYWGDSECDIAMTELFGGFMVDFYQGYESVRPLDSGYQSRRDIYNLYHLLNHCNLFGGHYLDEAQNIIDSLN